MKFLIGISITLLMVGGAAAQSNKPVPRPKNPPLRSNPPPFSGPRTVDAGPQINLPDEMRVRLAIERAEDEHRKILEDVAKLSDLSTEVTRVFQERGALSEEEIKKLSSIEKLAKRILSHAGGKEVDDKSSEQQSLPLDAAINQLNIAVHNVQKTMTAETRFVVSASVIENSNDIINLAQFIRRTQKQSN